MKYNSTRNVSVAVTSKEAIAKGLADDRGLFVPQSFPQIDQAFLTGLCEKSYPEKAFSVFKLFLTDFTDAEIEQTVRLAYGSQFDSPQVAELSHLLTGTYMLELWHGPTCAFKDMALQALPHLLTTSMKTAAADKEVVILVATSGDTGKAALDGFCDVPGTKIMVFYPEHGVSDMQKRQMKTQLGSNVCVCAVKGNFDDCQTGVKNIFNNRTVSARLAEHGLVFSSANSMNWGRLLPQVVYYFSAYCDLVQNGELTLGDSINVAVPTGNFGNILAAYIAREMGLPIKQFICASNTNHILTDFIRTGIYDTNRAFVPTISPSMDILVSSNLERLLYFLSGCDAEKINSWFSALSATGKYTIDDATKEKLQSLFYGGYCAETDTMTTIREVWAEYAYLLDTHTAVAYKVHKAYREETGDTTPCIVVSTANPYKFVSAVHAALGESADGLDEFAVAERLEQKTGTVMPKQLRETRDMQERFNDSVATDGMLDAVYAFLGLAP